MLSIMFSSTRKQFKSCSVNASCLCRQKSCLNGINASCLSTRKQFKSCGVNASCVFQQELKQFKSGSVDVLCVCQQGSSLRVAVSVHHVFIR